MEGIAFTSTQDRLKEINELLNQKETELNAINKGLTASFVNAEKMLKAAIRRFNQNAESLSKQKEKPAVSRPSLPADVKLSTATRALRICTSQREKLDKLCMEVGYIGQLVSFYETTDSLLYEMIGSMQMTAPMLYLTCDEMRKGPIYNSVSSSLESILSTISSNFSKVTQLVDEIGELVRERNEIENRLTRAKQATEPSQSAANDLYTYALLNMRNPDRLWRTGSGSPSVESEGGRH